ncbi:TIGR03750 family conjugal transfer protein [Pseudomonas sp. 21LCFQ02]|uniref:TIGR03750 family conjugal transfer protein n=1 Tax=Pseudomonas sp. 21LCFQ02 TaxID=2957505 RepID=UPI00209BA006|nr:TIGR03750 family conjugal transfer protein [Pseudomonas sp. 21LCFQ02]MCO8166212.1 TIGR03750 family conjugal transfer protein [Pseudomonas sp. 21LCFQ02]
MADESIGEDGTLQFLPNNLNRQPVVMGGLTADEMWSTLGLSGVAGLLLGIPIAFAFGNPALVIAGGLVGGALGLTVASRILRRMKRGRPDTWFYRRVQLLIALHLPFLPFWNNLGLVIRSGAWSCRRTE